MARTATPINRQWLESCIQECNSKNMKGVMEFCKYVATQYNNNCKGFKTITYSIVYGRIKEWNLAIDVQPARVDHRSQVVIGTLPRREGGQEKDSPLLQTRTQSIVIDESKTVPIESMRPQLSIQQTTPPPSTINSANPLPKWKAIAGEADDDTLLQLAREISYIFAKYKIYIKSPDDLMTSTKKSSETNQRIKYAWSDARKQFKCPAPHGQAVSTQSDPVENKENSDV